jgi:hypothetical protein
MQETPPYSLVEIRILLSQYLDGALEPAQVIEIDGLMVQFPHYKEAFLKLQAARDAIQTSLEKAVENPVELRYTKISDMTWKNIAQRLDEDRQALSKNYDAEFISAYYDRELPAEDPDLQAFESQLYSNEDANRLLAGFGQVSDAIRQMGYRLENNCTVDLTEQVMAAFIQEQNPESLPEDNLPADNQLALLSAYADQELSPRETIEVNRLIENEENARSTLRNFNWISEQIQSLSLQLQTQVPDFWPKIEPILKKTPEEGGIVLPFDHKKRLKDLLKIAVPTAAAIFIIVASGLRLGINSDVEKVAKTSINGLQLASYQANNKNDLTSSDRMKGQFGVDSQDETLDVSAVMNSKHRSSQPLRPVFEPSPKIAAKPGTVTTDGEVANDGRTPSSEEYLFDALNEQVPAEDISNILGK